MATSTMRPIQTSPLAVVVVHFLRLSFLFLVTSSLLSVHAFTSCNNSLKHNNNNFISNHYYLFVSRSSSLNYASSTSPSFDVGNNNDQLWQLLEELIRRRSDLLNNNNNDPSSRDEFHQLIQSLYCESQLNIHNLEKEIEVLRQIRLETPPHHRTAHDDGMSGGSTTSSSTFSFQTTMKDNVAQDDDDNTNCSNHGSNTNHHVDEVVDEISNKLLKAVFVGYQWTEEDKKRLSSAHPRDYSR